MSINLLTTIMLISKLYFSDKIIIMINLKIIIIEIKGIIVVIIIDIPSF